MAKENYQKIKLLKLYELLKQETDIEHSLTTAQICMYLAQNGISCERRTLSKDIALLNECGYEILEKMIGHEKGYYVTDQTFTVPELKVMMDAIHGASFITQKKADYLITKIASLGGSHKEELLERNQPCFNIHRHSNEAIYYSLDACERALQQKKRLAFYYFDLNERMERVYRKNKQKYEVEPMAMIFNNNNYHLMCLSSNHDEITSYRLDRMEHVDILEYQVSDNAIIPSPDIATYANQAFSMYGGPIENAVIQFSDKLISMVYDMFGENTQMIRQDAFTCIATVQIQKSTSFWGWVFQFGKDLKILAPETLVTEYKEKSKELLSNA